MIDTKEKLQNEVRLRYRFLKSAAHEMDLKSNKDYQRFRNTVLGASRDLQVIKKLTKSFRNIDTYKIWGVNL
ncbi:MAG: hypothetical protein ABUK01_18975 [Leptospirales bacterium]